MDANSENRRSSILKPKKPRNPLGDLDLDSKTAADDSSKTCTRRISFANSNSVKPFVVDDEKNTIWDTTYEETLSTHESSQENTLQAKKHENASKTNTSFMELTAPITADSAKNFVNVSLLHKQAGAGLSLPDKENVPLLMENQEDFGRESLIAIARKQRSALLEQKGADVAPCASTMDFTSVLMGVNIYNDNKDGEVSMELTQQIPATTYILKPMENETLSSSNMSLTGVIDFQPVNVNNDLNKTALNEQDMEFTQQIPAIKPFVAQEIATDMTVSSVDMELETETVTSFKQTELKKKNSMEGKNDIDILKISNNKSCILDDESLLSMQDLSPMKLSNDFLKAPISEESVRSPKFIPSRFLNEEDVFEVSRPSRSEFSRILNGDYNPSFNSKIMNAYSMSFNSSIVNPDFLNKTAANNDDSENLEGEVSSSMEKIDSETTSRTSTESCFIVNEVSSRETGELENYKEIIAETTNAIKRERSRLKIHQMRHLKRMENLEALRADLEAVFSKFNDSTLITSTDSSSSCLTGDLGTLTETKVDCSDEKQPFLPNELLEKSVENKSIREKVEELALRCDNSWSIIRLEDNFCTFETLFGTLLVTVVLDSVDGIVNNLNVEKRIEDTSEPIAKFVCEIFIKKLQLQTVQSAMGGNEFDVISLLDYIFVTMQKMMDICSEFDRLQRDPHFLPIMDDDFRVSISIVSVNLPIHWIVTVDMSDINSINCSSVSVKTIVGKARESEIKKFVPECPKGFQFLPCFIEKVKSFVETLNKRFEFKKYKN